MASLFNNKNMFFNVLLCRNTKSHFNTPGRIKETLFQVDWFRYHQKYDTFLGQAKHDKSTYIEFKITYQVLLIDMRVDEITAWEMEITT